MAVSSSAVNLAQYANMSNDPLVKAVVMSLRDNGSILADLPIVTNPTMKVKGSRWEGNLPTVDWVKINEEATTTSGTPTPFEEQGYIIRNNIDVDKYLVMDKTQIQDPRAVQLQAYLKAVAYDINFKFIKNNHQSGDADAPVGLQERLRVPSTYGTRADCLIDGGGVDMTSAMTAATANTFLELMDQVLWAVDSQEGDNVVIYMNEVLKRRFARALRLLGASGGFSQALDQYGRTVEKFRNATLRDIGYKADQSTRIITATETAAGTADTGSTYTSLYAVNFSEGYTSAWQMEPLKPTDKGLLEGGAVYRILIDWFVGLLFQNTRSIARVYDIKVA